VGLQLELGVGRVKSTYSNPNQIFFRPKVEYSLWVLDLVDYDILRNADDLVVWENPHITGPSHI